MTTVGLLAACTKFIYVYSVGEADNTIVLSAGMSDGASTLQTKADGESPEDGANFPHSKHKAINPGVKLALRVDGLWYKAATGETPVQISQSTVATVGDETSTLSGHSKVTMSPVLYWDDYGTADPYNIGSNYHSPIVRGRERGLDVFGVGVNDASVTSAPSVSNWTAFAWTLPANQIEKWTDKDLIISNNIKYSTTASQDKAYKFSQHTTGRVLEFTHAMSKITVEVRPDDTFGEGGFTNPPVVEFKTKFKMTGSVNIITGEVSATGNPDYLTLKMYEPTGESKTYTYDGLVMSGNTLTDNVDFIEVTADGNNYKITTHKLFEKMNEVDHNGVFHSGKNYIVRIQLGKTAINVTATVVDWVNVLPEEVNPSINISAVVGKTDGDTPSTATSFSFFDRVDGVDTDLYGSVAAGENPYYTADAVLAFDPSKEESKRWSLTPLLYWPDHNTHLHMRGVYPQVGTSSESTSKPVVTGDVVANQSIAVSNAAYVQGTFPSDLMIAKPEVVDGTLCPGVHTAGKVLVDQHGICATTGRINLTFRYMMSQVEVRLKTAQSISHDQSQPAPDAVDLTNAEVSVVGIQTVGSVTLDGIVMTPSGDRTTKENHYVIPAISGAEARGGIPAENIRHAAIVPQDLRYTSTPGGTQQNVQFRIELKKGDNHDQPASVYYVNVWNLMHDNTTPATPNEKWEAGRHYIYTFDLRRTGVEVTATIVPWVEAEAESDVWM